MGAIEEPFYEQFVAGLGLDVSALPDRLDRGSWDRLHRMFGEIVLTRTRDDWARLFEDLDACVTPVLTFEDSIGQPHVTAKRSLVRHGGTVVAGTAPRFSGEPPPVSAVGQGTNQSGVSTPSELRERWSSETTRA